ncbi:hypothetical protein [Iodobacter fluviatilis]|uniref:Sulfite dehydrogenase n=1 Tax=Iodobacter fluviatilis TaxID=537 RepID=A0A377Q6E1_9NEIS|nr:hypothetical protein [Iodobacter fluviatilis]TCU89476.1 sulfite dehydrogenase [Iodobacter fluviatilis]STQ90846.1 Uncharacterised protein [Iodobacter fluviatilis]
MKYIGLTIALFTFINPALALEIKLPAETSMYPANANPAYVTTLQKCLICHSADYALYQPNLSEKEWFKITEKMRLSFKAPITQQEASQIAAYLFQTQQDRVRPARQK